MQIKDYQLLAKVRSAPMQLTYSALHTPTGLPASITLLKPRVSTNQNDPYFQKRFASVARRIKGLEHRAIAQVTDFGNMRLTASSTQDDGFFVVSREPVNRTLQDALDTPEGGFLEKEEDLLAFLRDIVDALAYAHERGVLHGDLSASNLLLLPDPKARRHRPCLTGFALINTIRTEHSLKSDQTNQFLAPEIRMGNLGDERSDLYSFGVMLLRMLQFRTQLYDSQQAPALSDKASLYTIMQRCTAPRPEERLQSVAELSAMLAELEGPQAAPAPSPTPTPSMITLPPVTPPPTPTPIPVLSSEPPQKSGRALPLVAIAAVACFAVLGAGWLIRTTSAPGTAPAEAPITTAPAPAAPQNVVMMFTVQSEPAGAQVWEGNRLLGVTPLTLEHDLSGVPERPLELRMDGYRTSSLVWTPSDGDPTLTLSEAPKPSAAPEPPPPASSSSSRKKPRREAAPDPEPAPAAATTPDSSLMLDRRGTKADDPAPASKPSSDDGLFYER